MSKSPRGFFGAVPILSLLALATLCVVAFTLCPMQADDSEAAGKYDFVADGFKYKIISETEKTVSLIGPVNPPTSPTPLALRGEATNESTTYTVTIIGDSAFKEMEYYTGGIEIPTSVKTIGDYAFYKCSGFSGTLTLHGDMKK